MSTPLGFMVFERCEDYEQGLVLRTGRNLPPAGVLGFANDDKDRRAVFGTRQEAREAIRRTEHYRLAFSESSMPQAKQCVTVPIEQVLRSAT